MLVAFDMAARHSLLKPPTPVIDGVGLRGGKGVREVFDRGTLSDRLGTLGGEWSLRLRYGLRNPQRTLILRHWLGGGITDCGSAAQGSDREG